VLDHVGNRRGPRLALVAEDAAVCFRKIVVGQTFVSVPGFYL
jgi:hypothetical protein